MINSIQHLIEKEIYEIEKTMRKFVEGALDIDSYGKELQERSLNLARNILVETLETMDQTIKNSAERLEAYVVEQNGQPKELLLPLGSIRFKRTCYTSKKTGKSVYLLDEVIGIEGHQRITMGAAAAILEETLESSYRKGGEHASLMDSVSKQTVKNLVHDTVIELPIQEREEKKSIFSVLAACMAVNRKEISFGLIIGINIRGKISPFIFDVAHDIHIISFHTEICQEMLAGIDSGIMCRMGLVFPLF